MTNEIPDHQPRATVGTAGPTAATSTTVGSADGTTVGNGDGASDRLSLRDRVIEAGLAVLDRDGLGLGARSLTYTRVFDHLEREHGIKVTRASVHERIWASHDDFCRDVVTEAIAGLPTDLYANRDDEVRDWVIDMWERGLDADERVAELARQLGPLVFAMIGEMPAYRDIQKAKAMAVAVPSDDPVTAALRAAISDRVDAVLPVVRDRMAALTAGLGLRPRAALGLGGPGSHELLAVVYMNLMLGAYLDVNSGSDEIIEPLALLGLPATGPAPWTMLAIGVQATINLLYQDASDGLPEVDDPPRPEPVVAPRISVGDRGRRRQRDELRALVLAAGVEVLLQDRMDLRPEALSYASVFAHLREEQGITLFRSSVHNRLWSSHDEFLLDVLIRGIAGDPGPDDPATTELIEPIRADVAAGTVQRRQAAADILRTVTAAEIEHHLASTDHLRRQAIKVALLTEPGSEVMTSLRRAIHQTQLQRVQHHLAVVRDQVLPLGFEVKPELGIGRDEALRILAVVALTSVGGAVFDLSAGVRAVSRTYPIRRDGGGTDHWLAPCVVTRACFEQLFRETDADPGTRSG